MKKRRPPSKRRRPTRRRRARPVRRPARRRTPAARRSAQAAGALAVRRAPDVRARRRPAGRQSVRWNANPDEVERAVARLVLTLVEFIRKLLERQAVRRVEKRTLTPAETEAIGLALMRIEATVAKMARRFGVSPKDLNLDLGPLGRLS